MFLRKANSRPGRTMQFRIIRALWAILFLLCLAVWIMIGERVDRALNMSLDESLESIAQYASADTRLLLALPGLPASKGKHWSTGKGDVFYEVHSLTGGGVLAKSASLPANQDLLGQHPWRKMRGRDEEGWNVRFGRTALRCLATKISISSEKTSEARALLIVGMERGQADRRWREIVIRSGVGLVSLLISTSLGMWLVVERASRPLAALIQEVSQIDPEDIQPVEVPRDPEIALLAKRVNASLEAVSQSLEREKRFSANVAHELLTPVGGLRTIVEVTLMRSRSTEELRSALEQCGLITDQMQGLAENLLTLSRLERRAYLADFEQVGLKEIVNRVWRIFAVMGDRQGISFSNQIGDDVAVLVIPGLLEIILKNLLGNCVRYTKPGGKVWTECQKDGERITFQVCNTANKMPEDFALHAFEPFWRGDASRNRRTDSIQEGTGLGLSLALSAARAMGWVLCVAVDESATVCFSMRQDQDA